jgi:hypothetical protein
MIKSVQSMGLAAVLWLRLPLPTPRRRESSGRGLPKRWCGYIGLADSIVPYWWRKRYWRSARRTLPEPSRRGHGAEQLALPYRATNPILEGQQLEERAVTVMAIKR